MGYTLTWTPPTIALRNDLTAWKALFNDVSDKIVASGLVQTSDTGQLDITAVGALPAHNVMAGYRIYRFDDALQATCPIFMKLEFGVSSEGMSTSGVRTLCPSISIQFSTGTNGAGVLTGSVSRKFYAPDEYRSVEVDIATTPTQVGVSYMCHNQAAGFFGLVYGAGSRNQPFAISSGNYIGATISVIVQRTLSPSGLPTGEGFMVYMPSLTGPVSANTWETAVLTNSYSQFISTTAAATAQNAIQKRYDDYLLPYLNTKPYCMPLLAKSDTKLYSFDHAVHHYQYTLGQGQQFQLEVRPGVRKTFISLGNMTGYSIDSTLGQRSSIAMLYE